MRILLVEDDQHLGAAIRIGLEQHQYTVDWVQDGLSAKQAVLNESFDVIILDRGLPKLSGLEILKIMRSHNNETPVLVLTARDSIEDRVEGLDAGADDYLVKPFDMDELLARMRALQRRHADRAEPELKYNNIVLDPAAHTVHYNGQLQTLSRREFSLLQKLLENPGRVLSRDVLTQTLYGWGDDVDSNALEVHIHNLRKKFGPDLIRTIRGVGYMVDKANEE